MEKKSGVVIMHGKKKKIVLRAICITCHYVSPGTCSGLFSHQMQEGKAKPATMTTAASPLQIIKPTSLLKSKIKSLAKKKKCILKQMDCDIC